MSEYAQPIWPFLVYVGLVVLLAVAMLGGSYLVGEHHRAPGRDLPYESGATPRGSARVPFGVQYYLVGVFFLLFDLEGAFVFTWAVAFYEVGWAGYLAIGIFIFTLLLGLIYVWKDGGLDWYRHAAPARAREAGE